MYCILIPSILLLYFIILFYLYYCPTICLYVKTLGERNGGKMTKNCYMEKNTFKVNQILVVNLKLSVLPI